MIRKVPNMSAWVMRYKDVRWWLPMSTIKFWRSVCHLPIFDTHPQTFYDFKAGDDDLVLVVNEYFSFTLEQVDDINKTWNLFYEN